MQNVERRVIKRWAAPNWIRDPEEYVRKGIP